MPPAIANRFALFADGHEEPSPVVEPPAQFNPFVNQVADNDNPWEEVKRGGQTSKLNVRTLAIRDHHRTPVIRYPPKQHRDFSASTGDSDSMKPADPHEHWCGMCQLHFPNKAALLIHMKQSPRSHENYCNLCKRVFKDRNGLKNHVDNAAGHEIFCNICLSAFVNAWGLKNHFENNYSVVGHEFVCLVCLLGFRQKAELDKHLETATKHVWCQTCHRRFRNQDERDAHWAQTQRHRHCLQPGCDFDAPNDNVLEKHHREDHFQCEGCKRIFPSQTKLNLHHQTCQFEVSCPDCGQQCAGQGALALHMETCFYCAQCHFQANNEGNYQIHMTKHTAADIPCWRCSLVMRKYSSLINHLESGKCPALPDPTQLMRCLGTFWHSTLYMDVDIHVQIRSNQVNLDETIKWMKEGCLQPFVCRAPGCGRTFSQFSSLLLHVESQACEWDVDTLRLDLLEAEFARMCERRDSVTAVSG